MGSDIHGVIEVKQYPDDPEHSYWAEVVNVGNLIGRDYRGFALFFGVRNSYEYKPFFEGRGIPEDSTLKDVKMEGEYHSASHFNLKDLRKLDFGRLMVETLPWPQQWNALLDIMRTLSDLNGVDNVRCVVYFDC